MRISGDPADPHFIPAEHCRGVVVFYNGTPIQGCITVDEELGWALCEARDRWGNVQVDYAAQEFLTREITGTFRVFIPMLDPADGFDAWMRERTDAAHAAYMAHNSAGGKKY